MEIPKSATTRPDTNAPLPSSIEVRYLSYGFPPGTCVMYLTDSSTQAIGTPSASRPPISSQRAGPSTAPIVVESSSSDEPMAQATEQDTTASQAQHEEIRFKMVSS